jgi:hypothetical protein
VAGRARGLRDDRFDRGQELTRAKDDERRKLFLQPYGSMPRLLMVWLITEAIKKRERVIPLGTSFDVLTRSICLNPATGVGSVVLTTKADADNQNHRRSSGHRSVECGKCNRQRVIHASLIIDE